MKLGLYTFADVVPDPRTGGAVTPGQRLRDLLEEIELADRLGLDVFGIGEHHRQDYAASSPAVVLAAAAARTRRIRLTSAVTVLSSEDPVRVHQQFATLDLLSGGRAEMMVGRGSFIESFPLFGQSLDDYDSLFSENLDLLLRIRAGERVSWPGGHRAAIQDRGVYPRPEHEIPLWVAVGGTPQSAARAGSLGLPMALAIIGGEPARFAPLIDLYREAGRRAGMADSQLQVGINSHGLVADTPEQAARDFYPFYAEMMTRLGRERGWPSMTRDHFEAGTGPRGHLVVGGPDQVVEKILFQHRHFRHDRFLMQTSLGAVPHEAVMRSIELFGTKVAPAVRAALAR
jgi:probable LLM family oxidoreductase